MQLGCCLDRDNVTGLSYAVFMRHSVPTFLILLQYFKPVHVDISFSGKDMASLLLKDKTEPLFYVKPYTSSM